MTNGCQSISNQSLVRATRPRETLEKEYHLTKNALGGLQPRRKHSQVNRYNKRVGGSVPCFSCPHAAVLEQNAKPLVPRPASCLSLCVHVLGCTLWNFLVKNVPLWQKREYLWVVDRLGHYHVLLSKTCCNLYNFLTLYRPNNSLINCGNNNSSESVIWICSHNLNALNVIYIFF